MQTQIGRAVSASGSLCPAAPKAASPLQREINDLKACLEIQEKQLLELKERLRPVFQDSPSRPEAAKQDNEPVSEVPAMVRDCRFHLNRNTEVVSWLLERIEV